jgi:hypothetical protein
MLNKILAACAASFMLVGGGAIAQAVSPNAPQTTTSSAPAADTAPVAMPQELPGEATAMRLCSQCHSFASATQRGHTREEWNGIIGRMIEQGLTAPDEELMEVSDYLTTNHGPPAA